MGRRGRGTAGSDVRVLAFVDVVDVVDVEDVEDVEDGSGEEGPVAGRRPRSRRSRLVVGAGVCAAALVVGGLVLGETVDGRRAERVAAAGGLRPLAADAEVVWRVEPPEASQDPFLAAWNLPVVAGGTLVVARTDVTGYDPATGAVRWRVPEAFGPAGSGQRGTSCEDGGASSDSRGLLICMTSVFQRESASGAVTVLDRLLGFQALDPVTGAVVASRAFEEGTRGAAVFGGGVATVRWGADGKAVVDLVDPVTGTSTWSREIEVVRSKGALPDDDYLGLWSDGSVLGVDGVGRVVTLDAAGGAGAGTFDSFTVPLREGRSVVQRTDGSSSTVLDREGNEAFRVEGRVQEFGASDGSPTRVLLVTEGGGVMDASGATVRAITSALDPAGGRILWTEERMVDAAVAQVGDVGVLSGAGRLWAVDLESGEQLWEASGIQVYTGAFTDGTDLYLVGSSATGGTRITAISVDSGHELWVRDLVDSAAVSMGVGGTLVGWSQDGTVFGVG